MLGVYKIFILYNDKNITKTKLNDIILTTKTSCNHDIFILKCKKMLKKNFDNKFYMHKHLNLVFLLQIYKKTFENRILFFFSTVMSIHIFIHKTNQLKFECMRYMLYSFVLYLGLVPNLG